VRGRRGVLKTSFGPFTLDGDTRQLTRDGRPIHLSPKAFELLAALAAERPNVLSKAVLQQRLWPETFVAEANLSNLIAEVRAALGDSARTPTYLRTVHKFGYAFCGQATDSSAPVAAETHVVCWLEWGTKRFPLTPGAHVIGRDPDAEIRLDGSTVSRRHARVIVNADRVVLEDSGSKNGTFRGAERVTDPVALSDGDRLRIGSVQIVFHLRGRDSTETQTQQGSGI
jgi:DNA-binding winged helix-turn-helix (wHTH) protein